MDGTSGPSASPRREALRLLPLVSFVALTTMAGCMGYAFASRSTWPYDITPGLNTLWLAAALAFGGGAAAIAVLFGVDTLRATRGRALRPPPTAVLLLGIALLVFGMAALALGQGESYGTAPHGIGYAVLITYVTAALVLFALGFLGYRPSPRPVDRWAAILATAHGLMGIGWGFALAFVTVAPGIIAT